MLVEGAIMLLPCQPEMGRGGRVVGDLLDEDLHLLVDHLEHALGIGLDQIYLVHGHNRLLTTLC